jgi:hypothetical protein
MLGHWATRLGPLREETRARMRCFEPKRGQPISIESSRRGDSVRGSSTNCGNKIEPRSTKIQSQQTTFLGNLKLFSTLEAARLVGLAPSRLLLLWRSRTVAKLKIDFQAHSLLTVKDFLTNPIGVPRVSCLQRVSTNDSSMSSWFDGIGVVEASLHDFAS